MGEKVSVNFSRLPHPLVRIFEPALPFKPSMLEKDSNSQLQLPSLALVLDCKRSTATSHTQIHTLFSLFDITHTKDFQEWLFCCSLHNSNTCLNKGLFWGNVASQHPK